MTLSVSVIASTVDHATLYALVSAPGDVEVSWPHGFTNEGPPAMSADLLAEFAGRACYQSWGRPNPSTATNDGYLSNIIDHGHFSVLEHANITFYIEGVSRALTHELIRHRHFSPSQLSQRFVDEAEVSFVIPPILRDIYLESGRSLEEIEDDFNADPAFDAVREAYISTVDFLLDTGASRKEAREAARAYLPNAAETKIVLTGNLRTIREFVAKRTSFAADREIRELAQEMQRLAELVAPGCMQNIGTA